MDTKALIRCALASWLLMAQGALADTNPWLEPEDIEAPSAAVVAQAPKLPNQRPSDGNRENRRRPTRYGMGYEQRQRFYSNRMGGGWRRGARARGGMPRR